jgi:hypothetical protein
MSEQQEQSGVTPDIDSPLPWRVRDRIHILAVGDEDNPVATCVIYDDARYIVQCCNAYPQLTRDHERLKEELADVKRLFAGVPDPTQADDMHVDRLVRLITASLANGGCSNCGGLPHTTTCRVGRLANAFTASNANILTALRALRDEMRAVTLTDGRKYLDKWADTITSLLPEDQR